MEQLSFDFGEEGFIDKPIRLIELFSGYGSQSMALRNINADFETYKAVEIDKYAINSFNAVHNTNFKTQDITNIKGSDLEIKERDKYEYIMFYSFPCFSANALVLTSTGYKKIIDVEIGDMVIGHDNQYHKVLDVKENGEKETVTFRGLECTLNHKFYVKGKGWVELGKIKKGDFVGIAINQKNECSIKDKKFYAWTGRTMYKIKQIPAFTINLPIKYLKIVLRYFLEKQNKKIEGKLEYLLAIQQLIAKTYKKYCPINIINGKSTLSLFAESETFYEDGYIWIPFNGYKSKGIQKVYDLTVEDSHSYTVNNIIVHNCTDISYAGLQKGLTEGSGTSSSLLWEVKRILLELKKTNSLPQTLIMENVKALVGKKNMPEFQKWLDFLSEIGYKTTYKVLNTKDYGIPQNRERVFAVSFLDHSRSFTFPSPIPLKTSLRDLLEEEVDDGYYMKGEKAEKLIKELLERYTLDDFLNVVNCTKNGDARAVLSSYYKQGLGCVNREKGIATQAVVEKMPIDLTLSEPEIKKTANCVTTKDRAISNRKKEGNGVVTLIDMSINNPGIKDITNCIPTRENRGISNHAKEGNGIIELKQIGNIFPSDNRNNPSPGRVYSVKGLSPTLTCMNGGGHRQPFIVVAMRGRYKDNPSLRISGLPTEQRLEPNMTGCVNTITSVQKDSLIYEYYEMRLRKLTPRECLRLQGVKDEDIDKMEGVNSKTQLYKQAGNSITVDVLEAIFRQMVREKDKNV